jgi:hypothetical protein
MSSGSMKTPKGTSLCQHASFEPFCIFLRRRVWAVRVPVKLDGYIKRLKKELKTITYHVYVQAPSYDRLQLFLAYQ